MTTLRPLIGTRVLWQDIWPLEQRSLAPVDVFAPKNAVSEKSSHYRSWHSIAESWEEKCQSCSSDGILDPRVMSSTLVHERPPKTLRIKYSEDDGELKDDLLPSL